MEKKYFLIISLILFSISLTQIAFYQSIDCAEEAEGWVALIYGWGGIFNGSLICLSWLANPALIVSWFTIKKTNISFTFSILALFFCSFFYIYEILTNELKITHFVGCYLWTLSALIMFLGNLYLITKKRASR